MDLQVEGCKTCERDGIALPNAVFSCGKHMPQEWADLAISVNRLADPILGKDGVWPYGPNRILRSRVEMVMWAHSKNLRIFESRSGHRRDAFMRGSGGQKIERADWQDHVTLWKSRETGKLACLVAHPYKSLDAHLRAELDAVVEKAPLLTYEAREEGWYGSATTMITLWREDRHG